MDVQLLRWPADAVKRERCRQLGLPRLLVIEGQLDPPPPDPLEDWVRMPLSPADLRARMAALGERARRLAVPVVDADHVLHYNAGAVPLSRIEAALATQFAESFRQVVSRQLLIERAWAERPRAPRNALDLQVLRLRRKICPLGLAVGTVWGRGYLLTSADP